MRDSGHSSAWEGGEEGRLSSCQEGRVQLASTQCCGHSFSTPPASPYTRTPSSCPLISDSESVELGVLCLFLEHKTVPLGEWGGGNRFFCEWESRHQAPSPLHEQRLSEGETAQGLETGQISNQRHLLHFLSV